ncbi:hypothetical protein GS682_15800 [Nostoc sp. B(2019)]|nr:hypothetical protein [Nostoc sp. B(2019)]
MAEPLQELGEVLMPLLKSSVRFWRWRSHRYAALTAQPFFQNGCLVSFGHKGEAQGFAPLGSDKDHRRKPPL